MAETAANKASVAGLIDELAVFIKQKRAKVRKIESASNKGRKDNNSSWAKKYPIQIHGSITIWKAKGDNGGQVQYERQAARYAFEWQRSKEGWRHDNVWVQEYLVGALISRGIPYPWQGKMIRELQLILTVRDEDFGNKLCDAQLFRYTGALIKLLQWRQRGGVDPTHGMVEVKP